MEFTERELELAVDMKKAGLEWCPKCSDIVSCRYNDWEWVLMVLKEQGDNQVFCYEPTPEKPAQEFAVLEKERVTWLPFWHQGRKILEDNNIVIQLFDLQNHVEIYCYRTVGKGKWCSRFPLGSVKGETDLDALYQAILLFVLPKEEEDK